MKKKICFVLSAEYTLKYFLVYQMRRLGDIYDLTIIINSNNPFLLSELNINGALKNISIQRKISIFSDVKNVLEIFVFFKKNKFAVVHSITPKAGLLTALAAFFAGKKIRIHTFTGQIWASKSNLNRLFLKFFDKIISVFSTTVIVDSPSQLKFLRQELVLSKSKGQVMGAGSLSGVNLNRFSFNSEIRKTYREKYKILDNETVFLFVGRLTKDKGILELAKAFAALRELNDKPHLWIVGPDEENITMQVKIVLGSSVDKVRFFGSTSTPEDFMSASDILCLPSHREGFGTVIIEAGAIGIPTIGSRIYGITDAIVENVTGIMHNMGDYTDLQAKMTILLNDTDLRTRMGLNASQRVKNFFSEVIVAEEIIKLYESLLSKG